MNEIKETIEGLRVLNKYQVFSDSRDYSSKKLHHFISQAIKCLEALDSAEGELEKKTKEDYPEGEWRTICDNETYISIASGNFNQAIDIARPILAKKNLRIEELEKVNKTLNTSLGCKSIIIRDADKQLQSAKLRIEELEKVIKTNKYICEKCWTSSYAPCPNGTKGSHKDQFGKGYIVCQMCGAIEELQSLKEKLTVENVKAQLISCFFMLYPQLNGQDIPLSTVLRSIDTMTTKDLLKLLEPNLEFVAQALIKELGGKDDKE